MDWMSATQILGNVGEFIGGVVVLVTLLYLAYQLRQGTRSLHRADVRSIMERFDAFWISMQNLETAELWLKGLAGELEQPAERFSFLSLLVRYTYAMQNLWQSTDLGISPGESWSQHAPQFSEFLATPGAAENWPMVKRALDPRFVKEVEKNLSSG